MCGSFGVVAREDEYPAAYSLTRNLMLATQVRGPDATGIAAMNGSTHVYGKAATPAASFVHSNTFQLLKVVKPSKYILGPGDGLVLNIWGSVQALYELTVFADGKIIIPTVGSLYVNGISLKKAQLLVTDA